MNLDELIGTTDGNAGATEKELQTFESELGFSLPAQYRKFLSLTAGGDNDQCHIESLGFGIAYVGGVAQESKHPLSDLRFFYQIEDGYRIPKDLLPIMDDGCGNIICIVVSGSNTGKIFLWCHETELLMYDESGEKFIKDYTSENSPNLDFVANSFLEFVGMLEIFDENSVDG